MENLVGMWHITTNEAAAGSLNLLGPRESIAFHLTVRSQDETVVMNSCLAAGEWGEEEHLALPTTRPLQLSMRVDARGFAVELLDAGSRSFHLYAHRMPLASITRLVGCDAWHIVPPGDPDGALLARIRFDKGTPVPRADFEAAPGGWQGRVLRGWLAGERAAVKFFIANASPESEFYTGRPQTDDEMRATWRAESRALRALSESGAAAVTARMMGAGEVADVGRVLEGFEGRRALFIVQEELAETLEDALTALFLRSVAAMASALAVLHASGFAHGDVHRGNFMFTAGGERIAKLIDFGNTRGLIDERARHDVACFGRRVLTPLPAASEFSSATTREILIALEDLCARCAADAPAAALSAAALAAELADLAVLAVEDRPGCVRLEVVEPCGGEPPRCLHVAAAGTAAGTPVRIARARPALHQLWLVRRIAGGGFHLIPAHAQALRLASSPGEAGLQPLAIEQLARGAAAQDWLLASSSSAGEAAGGDDAVCLLRARRSGGSGAGIFSASPQTSAPPLPPRLSRLEAPEGVALAASLGELAGGAAASSGSGESLALTSEPLRFLRFRLRAAALAIVHRASGLVLDHFGRSVTAQADGARHGVCGLYSRHGGENQQWLFEGAPGADAGGAFIVRNRASKLALDLDAAARAPCLWTPHGRQNQRWQLRRLEADEEAFSGEDAYRIVLRGDGGALDAGDVAAAAAGEERSALLSFRPVARGAAGQIFTLLFA